MTLDELIAQSTNPQEFTRLCNAVFTDMYGHGYQVIDGTRGDNGNDGYVVAEARMLAMHCPVKPEQRTDADYLEKIRTDLAKATKLKAEGKYPVERWTFITPRKLADGIISTMRAAAAQVGLDASHVESTFLANELFRRRHILDAFPALQQLNISAQLEELKQTFAGRAHQTAQAAETTPEPPVTDRQGAERVYAISNGVPTEQGKAELRVIAYGTTDLIVEMNAILTLLRWFEPADDDHAELIAFADRGARLADQLAKADVRACCHAHKSQVLAMAFNLQFVETYYSQLTEQKVGLALTSISDKQQQQVHLRAMDGAWRTEAQAALELLKGSTASFGVGATLEILGTTLGQLAHIHRHIGASADADRYLGECKTLLMAAKDMYRSVGDELGAANALFNLANQIRFHGRSAEALQLVKVVMPVAEQYSDRVLFQKSLWLQEAITTGKVPAYEAGERRAWTAGNPEKPE